MISEQAMPPKANGRNDHALWGVPPIKKVGICQVIQMMPCSKPATKGICFLCIMGSASPHHPNSSIGPSNKACTNAGNMRYQGEKGNGSVAVPLIAAPPYIAAGITRIMNTHHHGDPRTRVALRKKRPRFLDPNLSQTMIVLAIRGEYTARINKGLPILTSPNMAVTWSYATNNRAASPQVKPKAMIKKGLSKLVV